VRNAATLAGNTMLVLDHIEHGEPFPSDLLTGLVATGAEITVWWALADDDPRRMPMASLVERVAADRGALNGLVILTYHLPAAAGPVTVAQKVALRDVNAHSLVNATTALRLAGLEVDDAVLTFGGLAPCPWRARQTEEALRNTTLSLAEFPRLAGVLHDEVTAELARWHERMAVVPWEGITNEYRLQLAVSFLYNKAIVNALLAVAPATVPEAERSAGVDRWGSWPLSGGGQSYEIQDWKAPVSPPYVKLRGSTRPPGRSGTPTSPRCRRARSTPPSCRAAGPWPITTSACPAMTGRRTSRPCSGTYGNAGQASSSWSPGSRFPIKGSTARAWAATSRCSRWSRCPTSARPSRWWPPGRGDAQGVPSIDSRYQAEPARK